MNLIVYLVGGITTQKRTISSVPTHSNLMVYLKSEYLKDQKNCPHTKLQTAFSNHIVVVSGIVVISSVMYV